MLSGAKPARWRRWMLEALLIVGLVVAVHLWQSRGLPDAEAPPLAGRLLDGSSVELAELSRAAGGKPVLVAFWSTWCPLCKTELSSLAAVGRDWPLLSVAMQSGGADEVGKFLAERRLALPTVNDRDGLLSARYRVSGVPTHFIVDAAGKVRFRSVGYTTELGLRFRLWWAERV